MRAVVVRDFSFSLAEVLAENLQTDQGVSSEVWPEDGEAP